MGGWEAVARAETVEMDEKGRVHIPANVRREVKARRFTLSLEEGRILMDPVKSPALVKGKYEGLLKVTMEELDLPDRRSGAGEGVPGFCGKGRAGGEEVDV